MPRVCTICAHKQRTEMEAALLDGASFRDIAGQFQVSKDALARHRRETNETPTPASANRLNAARNATAKRSIAQHSWNKLERVSVAEINDTKATNAPPIPLLMRNATNEPATTSKPEKKESSNVVTLLGAAHFVAVHDARGEERMVTGKYWQVFGRRDTENGWRLT